jgi:prepilin-type processing-associated H-X9-DG protein
MKTFLGIAASFVLFSLLSGCNLLPGSAREIEVMEINNLRQIAVGCHIYATDNDGQLPRSLEALAPYIEGVDWSEIELVAKGLEISEIDVATTVLARSTKDFASGKIAVAYVDGHVVLE